MNLNELLNTPIHNASDIDLTSHTDIYSLKLKLKEKIMLYISDYYSNKYIKFNLEYYNHNNNGCCFTMNFIFYYKDKKHFCIKERNKKETIFQYLKAISFDNPEASMFLNNLLFIINKNHIKIEV